MNPDFDPRPFLRHQALASQWCRVTHRSTTEAAILRMMDRYTAVELQGFLRELARVEIPADLLVSHGQVG